MASKAFLDLSAIANKSDATSKEQDVISLLTQNLQDTETTFYYITGLIKQPMLPIKSVLSQIVDLIDQDSEITEEMKEKYYNDLINTFTPPTANTSLGLMKSVLNLAKIYETKCQHQQANDILKSLQIESYMNDFRTTADFSEFKIKINSRIANNAAHYQDYEDAETYLVRISPLLHEFKDDKELIYPTLEIYANVMINLGRWLDVASRLYYLKDSYFDGMVLKFLLLAPFTSFKKTLLSTVKDPMNTCIWKNYQDTPLYPIINKMHESKLIYYEEYQSVLQYYLNNNEFSLSQEYYISELSKVIVENNLIAAAQLYENITIANFIDILKIDRNFVENVVSSMIREERLDALIDDISGIIEFNVMQLQHDPLVNWKLHIVETCTLLDNVVKELQG